MNRSILLVVVVLLAACGDEGKASGGPSGEAPVEARERLAAKRKELAGGGEAEATGGTRERLSRLRRSVPSAPQAAQRAEPVEPARPRKDPAPSDGGSDSQAGGAQGGPAAQASPKAAIPSHLSRRERLKRACYRDTFNITNLAVVPHMPESWRNFCPCMLDAIFSTGVSASHQEALIEDFSKNRDQVDAANPTFERRWKSRCPM
jgi:hypothetical protein